MLTEIRDRSSGVFAWVIAALIIIPMAFWGVQDYATTEANPVLVEFGDQKITQNQYQEELQTQQARMRERMGENANEALLGSDAFKQSVLRSLVNRALIQQVAKDENYQVSNEQLVSAIKDSELFQLDGEFNQEAYDRYLIGTRYTKKRYEDLMRQDLIMQQVTQGYDESAIVMPDDVRELLEFQAEKRSFDVLSVRKVDFVDEAEASEQEIADYYEQNPDRFMDPQKVSIQYIELNVDEIAPTIEVDEDELQAVYEQNQDNYMSTAKRETRHILLSTRGGEDEGEQLQKAQDLVEQLRNGADFAELAKEHSQDPGSARNGGSLGLVEPGQMVPEFEKATFELEQDAISEPIKSPFGYHIIQVLDIQSPEQQSFEDVRFDLLQAEREVRAQEQLINLTDQLKDLAFEQSDNLDAAAEQLELTLNTTDLFSRVQGSGIATSQVIRDVAFSEEVLVEGLNSEPIELGEGQVVVLRKLEEQPEAVKPLTEVSDQISVVVKDEKANAAALEAGEQLFEKAKADWDGVAADEALELASHTISLLEPNRAVAPNVTQAITDMQLNNGDPSYEMVTDFNGDVHILRLRTIAAGDISGVSEQIKEATRRVLAQRNGSALLNSYLQQLQQEKAPDLSTAL